MGGTAATIAIDEGLDAAFQDDDELDNALKVIGGEGKYKRKKSKFPRSRNLKLDKMGSTLARAAAKQAIKEGLKQVGKAIARNVTKKPLKRVAIKGAKSLAKGAAAAGAGVAIDASIQKIRGSGKKIKGMKSRPRRRKKLIKQKAKRKPISTKEFPCTLKRKFFQHM